MSRFRYRQEHPEATGYGPALAVTDTATGVLYGLVRECYGWADREPSYWVMYDPEGAEIGVGESRHAAAVELRRRWFWARQAATG